MIEPELGAMFKRIVSMAEDRCSDYAVGKAVMLLVDTATTAILNRHAPLSAAEKMDRAAGTDNHPSLKASRTVESNYKP